MTLLTSYYEVISGFSQPHSASFISIESPYAIVCALNDFDKQKHFIINDFIREYVSSCQSCYLLPYFDSFVRSS